MKFRVIHLEDYKQSSDFPFDFRIELVKYSLEELKQLKEWLRELNIPPPYATTDWGRVIFLKESDTAMFILRWT